MKFGNLDKMKIASSESKYNLGRSGKGLITSLCLKAKSSPEKYKKERYAIRNVIKKDLSKIIKEFKKLPYKSYERRRPKHNPNDSYFYLERQVKNCMMRGNTLNLHVSHVITEITGKQQILISQVCSSYKSKSEDFLVEKTLSGV